MNIPLRNKVHSAVLVSVTGILLCVCLSACGGGDRNAEAASRSSGGGAASTHEAPGKSYRTGDDDVDDENGKDPENSDPVKTDDYPLTAYGHPASPVEKSEITTLVRRYYAVAARDDAALACTLLYSPLARDPALTRTVPEDLYSRPARPRVLPGEGCAQVLSRLFKRRHRTLAGEAASLRVTGVRVDGPHGVALLGFATVGEEWIAVVREGTAWKLHALLGILLP